jgi:tetratricopeptide (TPR) repeat protein
MKDLQDSPVGEQDKAKIQAILSLFEGGQDFVRLAARYHSRYPGDPYAHLLALLTAARQDDFQEALASLGQWKKFFPDSIYFESLIVSHCYDQSGELAKSLEIAAALIKERPDLVNARITLIQPLIETGRLEEAGAQIAEALKIDPANELITYFAGEVELHKKNYAGACNYLRKFIGLTGSEGLKPLIYYKLYQMYEAKGDHMQAEKHLKIARNSGPEWDFKTNEEVKELIRSAAISPAVFSDMSPERFEFISGQAKADHTTVICSGLNNSGYSRLKYYELDFSGTFRNQVMWLDYNPSPREYRKVRLSLQSFPRSSFVDAEGNILKTSFKKNDSTSARFRYFANVQFQKPVKQRQLAFTAAEMDISDQCGKTDAGLSELLIHDTAPKMGFCRYVVAVPKEFKVLSVSAEPDERPELDDMNLLVYSKYFFRLEEFKLSVPVKR